MTTGKARARRSGRESELLVDLVYVFAFTRLSQRLLGDFTTQRRIVLTEVGQTVLLLLVLWLVWVLGAWTTSRLGSRRLAVQLVIVWTLFGSMILAVTLPHAFGPRAVVFAVTFVAMQAGRSLILVLTLSGPERSVPQRTLCWSLVSAVAWITGAVLFPQSPGRGVLWTLALVVDYVGFALGWPVPGLGRMRIAQGRIEGEHLADRYQQLVIIALGETILITGLTFADAFTPRQVLPTVLSFSITVLMWRIYLHRAGSFLETAIEAAEYPVVLARSNTYTHLAMVAGILATGTGFALVIGQPYGHADPSWLGVILGGPALFLAGRARFEYEVFGRVSWSRPLGLLALAALAPALLRLPPVAASGAATSVMAVIAGWDTVRDWKVPDPLPMPPT